MIMNLLDRRRFLVLAGGAAATTVGAQTLWQEAASAATLDPAPFTLGVASADPDPSSVALWTRLANDPAAGGGMPDRVIPVRWEVSRDEGFTKIVKTGVAQARPERAHSVQVVVDGLRPNAWYWYRFTADGATSRVGRTRTLPLPQDRAEHLRFAFASCQAWAGGRYAAYRDLAEQDVDLVVHLGDYIYETAAGSLAEFRRLHALYKSSPDLRDAHARFPFVTVWDDHDVLNNWADDHQGSPDGTPWAQRQSNAFQAYYEHLPMRTAPQGPDWQVYRRFRWGRLAEFSVLDTRQYRSDQACGDGMNKPPCDEVYEEDRTMTGPEQERWLLDGLATSTARWNVIAQQTIFAKFDYDLGPGLSYNLDQWDGYPAARQRILDALRKHRPSNPVIIGGDWHSAWVNDVLADFDDPTSEVLASEFIATSISSGIGWDAAVRQGLPANPHVKLYEGGYRGYVLCDVTPDRWQADLRIVLAPGDGASPAYTLARFEVRDGEPGARQLGAADGIAGVIRSGSSGLINAEVLVRRPDGSTMIRTWTDANGRWHLFVPPGSYRLEAHAVGYGSAGREITVESGGTVDGDFTLAAISEPFAAAGRYLPGPNAEGTAKDLLIGNDSVAMTVAAQFADPQLPGATPGKPINLAGIGHLDQLDWINLGLVATSRPTGTEAWQRGLVRCDQVAADGTEAVITTSGVAAEAAGITVATRYAAATDPWISVETTLTNTGAAPVTLWVGDAVDHDGPGQRSGVPGHGTISTPYGSPAEYRPTGPWIGMTGSDRQTYGIVYQDSEFTAYGNGNWIMSLREITLAAGQDWTLRRRITALDSGAGTDPWTVLDWLGAAD
ncbi:alkaline phosphatase D family protein [Microlunatus parietis]|uniref:Phosphodiesterase/alkaline phosphatase D-like protein n=1 Tax=Microlunatus parietis TaxID=682979 RepID=A0A7Y9LDM1_9ACTN|nr:alkaline phosphatase D family protein [Microlunatus parietis]NYE72945.1 phosphodiesterase/alkaline phosphatase D-like protein [Microlunatus parietis]